ncbi:uncharacterized protein LY89DRAFT_584744, partial [Mollisia scopiformis]
NPSRVPQILAGILLPTLFASIFVVARLYTRFIITRNWGNDDTLITIAWVTSLGLAVTNALLIPFGGGHHAIFQKPSQITPTLKIAFIGRLIYQFVLCLTKLGICLFYLRVFQDKASKRQVYMIAAFTIISALVIEIEFVFQCNPVSDAWNFVNPNCKATNPSVVTNCVCNIIADVWIMAFVIPRVLPLQMARRQKFSLLGVVSLGMLVIAASIVRCILVLMIGKQGMVTTWTTLEVATGLFCASAPCIRPLLRQIAPGFMSSLSQTFSGPSKARTKTGPSSKYGLGSVNRVGKRGEAFELSSRGEGDRATFWIEEGDNRKSAADSEESENSKGNITKTVVVSVRHDESSSSSLPAETKGWQNV